MISIKNLVKRYRNTNALDDLNLNLQAGRVVGLLGENGCGKTTLLRILAGLNQPTEGEVTIAGHTPGPETKRIVSYLPDAPHMPPSMSVLQMLDYYEDFYQDFDRNNCRNMLADMGIDRNAKFGQLSKGQREKVMVCLSMSRQAEVYLLDEPISGVDPAARDTTLRAIIGAIRPEALVIIATHLVDDVEPILDDVVLMRHGKILNATSLEELRESNNLSLNNYFKKVYTS